ncbi:uncharacterized protein KY384_003105 [Bacidia gigantensis]|uniref:uncharacterized protein n=1 Tax=Bacidia gigantensis TaxID=2732470 RepID=UPI001D04CD23|nr:uncharacterized protein KY384_003105 [Bacidia gigantensis]KAG8531476.1 hypothetical protein KY384_003105 [Bacidia gigantensis]
MFEPDFTTTRDQPSNQTADPMVATAATAKPSSKDPYAISQSPSIDSFILDCQSPAKQDFSHTNPDLQLQSNRTASSEDPFATPEPSTPPSPTASVSHGPREQRQRRRRGRRPHIRLPGHYLGHSESSGSSDSPGPSEPSGPSDPLNSARSEDLTGGPGRRFLVVKKWYRATQEWLARRKLAFQGKLARLQAKYAQLKDHEPKDERVFLLAGGNDRVRGDTPEGPDDGENL